MNTVLGLLGMIAFIACTVAFAAGVTWTVVRLTPKGKSRPQQPS